MTLDTNILIAYLDGEQMVVDFILEQKPRLEKNKGSNLY